MTLKEIRRQALILKRRGLSRSDIAKALKISKQQAAYAIRNKGYGGPHQTGSPVEFTGVYRRIADRAERRKP